MPGPVDIAVQRFRDGFNCSQSVLLAFADDFNLPPDVALRVAAPFGGGIARAGETCGALTGALMVLGLRYGTTIASDQEAKERQYQLARDLMAQFQRRHGSTLCRELLGCEIMTPEGRQRAHDRGLFDQICPRLVADAAERVKELLK
jgi:C_GCAxxG_C_C family probable redox protein